VKIKQNNYKKVSPVEKYVAIHKSTKNTHIAKLSRKPYSQSAETMGDLRKKGNCTQLELHN
jgi:hypothetical protein